MVGTLHLLMAHLKTLGSVLDASKTGGLTTQVQQPSRISVDEKTCFDVISHSGTFFAQMVSMSVNSQDVAIPMPMLMFIC